MIDFGVTVEIKLIADNRSERKTYKRLLHFVLTILARYYFTCTYSTFLGSSEKTLKNTALVNTLILIRGAGKHNKSMYTRISSSLWLTNIAENHIHFTKGWHVQFTIPLKTTTIHIIYTKACFFSVLLQFTITGHSLEHLRTTEDLRQARREGEKKKNRRRRRKQFLRARARSTINERRPHLERQDT